MRRFLVLTVAFLGACLGGASPLPKLPDYPSLPSTPLPAYPTLPARAPLPAGAPPASTPSPPASGDAPDYSSVTALYSWPDARVEKLAGGKAPFLEVLSVPELKTWQQHRAECQRATHDGKAPDAQHCPQYEWTVPFSMVDDSRSVATSLRAAWQRFEDRGYWRVMTQLNVLSDYPAFCLVNWQLGLGTKTPDVKGHVPSGVLPRQLAGKIETGDPDNALNLEDYSLPFPRVSYADFCDGLNWGEEPPDFMFLPGGCAYVFGVRTVCLGGGYGATGPGMGPIWFNQGEAQNRVRQALEHVNTRYYAEYQQDVLTALSPGQQPFFFPLPWHSQLPQDGAVIAPVMNLDVDPGQFVSLAREVRNKLGAFPGALSEAYYFQGALRSNVLDSLLLRVRKDVLLTPPGAWPFEEFKRTLGPSSLPYYERMGYVSFFEAWQQLRATTLPEPVAAKLLRGIVFHAYAVDTHFPGGEVIVPTDIPVAPYLVPFAGAQARFGWTAVPEGYQIPRTSRTPLFDYGPLVR